MAKPADHLDLLFAFFGRIPGTPAPLDTDGAIHDQSHAWMQQLGTDIQQLAEWDDSGLLFVAALGPLLLFTDSDFRAAFLQQDPWALTAKYLALQPTAPGQLQLPEEPSHEAGAENEVFVCDLHLLTANHALKFSQIFAPLHYTRRTACSMWHKGARWRLCSQSVTSAVLAGPFWLLGEWHGTICMIAERRRRHSASSTCSCAL